MEKAIVLQVLESSFCVFKGNFTELFRWLEHLQDSHQSLSLYSYENKDNVTLLLNECVRLFQNFVASAESLIEPIEKSIEKPNKNNYFAVYLDYLSEKKHQEQINRLQERINCLKGTPLRRFIKGLRNYTLHRTLPITNLEILCSDDLIYSIKVETEPLKKWKKWASLKPYINQFEDNFCLISIANDYFHLIESFCHELVLTLDENTKG